MTNQLPLGLKSEDIFLQMPDVFILFCWSFHFLIFFFCSQGVVVFIVYDNISELVPDTEQTGLDG